MLENSMIEGNIILLYNYYLKLIWEITQRLPNNDEMHTMFLNLVLRFTDMLIILHQVVRNSRRYDCVSKKKNYF